MANTTLDAYTQSVEADVSKASWLGRLVWYEFSKIQLPHSAMVEILAEENIRGPLPFCPEDINIFKKTCNEVVRRHNPKGTPVGHYSKFRLVNMDDSHSLTRRIVRDDIDSQGKKIASVEVVDVTFDRETGFVAPQQCNPDIPVDRVPPPANLLMEEMIAEYEAWRNCLDGAAVRGWVRDAVMNLGATRVSGSVYFVPQESEQAVDDLETLAKRVNAADPSDPTADWGHITIHSLPLIDNAKQREMVKEAFEQSADAEISEFLDEIGDALHANRTQSKLVSAQRYERIEQRYAELMTKTQDYQSMLSDHLDETNARMKMFFRSIVELQAITKET